MNAEEVFGNLKDEEVLFVSLEKPALFRIIMNRYEKAFLRKARGIVRQEEDAEDVVQDTFTKIYFNAEKFKKRPGVEFKSWAYKILVNTAINKYHKLKKRRNVEFSDEIINKEIIENSENMVLASDAKMDVDGAMSRLPPEPQKLLTSYYLEDRSYKDIAQERNMTGAALKMKLFRAKRMFKKALNDNLYV